MNIDWLELAANLGMEDISWGRTAAALVVFLIFLLLRKPLARMALWPVAGAIARLCSTTSKKVSEVVRNPLSLVPVLIGLYIAGHILRISGPAEEILNLLMRTLGVISTTWMTARAIRGVAQGSQALRKAISEEFIGWATRAIEFLVWLIGVAAALEIWGVQVAPLIASLGIIGVAVALGAQDFFKNLISGLVVLSEKRYRIGDRIQLAGVVDGSVEQIGFRSTRVRLFDGAPVSIPNAMLSDGALVNYGEIPWRRIRWYIGLEFRTTAKQLRNIRQKIEEHMLGNDDFVPGEKAAQQVRVDRFSDSSIDILVYGFANTTDWTKWMRTKEDLLFRIKEIVEEEGAGFAFPSRSIYIENSAPDASGR